MTVHQPDTGVVCEESEDQVAALAGGSVAWEERNIAARRIYKIQLNTTIVGTVTMC